MRLTPLAGSLVLLAAVTACGTETAPERDPAGQGDWRGQALVGEPGVDYPTLLETDGEDALVVMLSDAGVLQSHLSVDGEPFEDGGPTATGWEYAGLAGAVRYDGGWLTLGSGGLVETEDDEELTFEVRSFRSPDGLSWEEQPVTGFTAPAEVNALAEVDSTLVAVGSYRAAENPSMGGFRPMVWVSDDGSTWTGVDLPGVVDDGESYVGDLAVSDGRLFAVGKTDGHGMLWASSDAGQTWLASDDAAIRTSGYLARVEAEDGTVVVSGEGAGPATMLRSTDGGLSWWAPTSPPSQDEIEGYALLWSGAGRFYTMTEPSYEVWSESEVCYADLDQCRDAASSEAWALYASDDGDSWLPVDTSGIDAGDEAVEVTGTESGRVLTLHLVRTGVAVHTWPAGVELPSGSALAEPERAELVTVPEGEDPEPGVGYHAPLYIHCGMDWLYLGDRPWQRTDDGPDVETGAGDEIPENWPIAGQTIYGFATLGEGGVVAYTTEDGEVIATYEQTGKRPPGCD